MKHPYSFLSGLVALFFLLMSTKVSCQRMSEAAYIEDLEFLKKHLPERHKNLFAKIRPADFDSKVDKLIGQSASFDSESFLAALFKLMVSIRDEHTFVEAKFNHVLPIRFGLFKEGIFVTGIASPHASILGSRLVAINGHSAADLVRIFKEAIQHENLSYFHVRFLHYINYPALLKGLGIIDSDKEAVFTFADQQEKQFRVTLRPVEGDDVTKIELLSSGKSLLSQQKKNFYWYDYDRHKKILYLNYSKCANDESLPFPTFNEALFKVVDEQRPEKIVLDLRYNGGGNSAILAPFMERIKGSYLDKKDSFYVLIGKQTFSSALMNAVDLKKNSNATFIGESTAGTINHYGEVRGFSLPNSKIVIAYSTKYWEIWKGKKGPLLPDIKIEYSVKNYLQGKDEALLKVNSMPR